MRKNTKLFVLCLTLLAVCLAMSSFAAGFQKVTEYKGTFTDVPENQWYAKEVASAYELGFVNGKSDTLFDPNGTLTVAEAVTVASRAHASYNGKTIPEVNGENWYDMYIDYALENGIFEDGYFNSYKRTVRRYEMAVLIAGALPESHFAAKNDVTAIPDVNENEEYADTLLMLYKAGVVMGSDDYGTFHPTNPIKRSEFSAIVNRAALPENRVTGTLAPLPEMKEAYYLVDNYTLTSQARQQKRLASGWNYDNRYDQTLLTTGIVQPVSVDTTDKGYAAINRDIEPQTKGIMTLRAEYTINSKNCNGIRFYFADAKGNSIIEFITKDGVYAAKSATGEFKGTVKAEMGEHTIKAEIDLDNKKGYYTVDGAKVCDFTFGDFSEFRRIVLGTTVEDKISLAYSECHIYMNYLVNEEFFAPVYPIDWEKAENAEVFTGRFDANGTATLKLTDNTTVTKKFDKADTKFVFETFVLLPNAQDTGYINVGDVSVKLANSTISAGALSKVFKNHVWQCIHIEGDTAANTAKLYVNGKVQGDVALTADDISEISFKFEKKSADGYMLVDDVEVYNIYDYADYCPVPNPVNKNDDNTVIMSVCSLWREGTHYGWDYVSPYDECSPLMGYYDEGIPETADWETKLMVEHGVDAFQYCWYYGGDTTWKTPQKTPRLSHSQHDGFFYSKYSDMIDFCFMWENAGFTSTKMTVEQFKTYIWDYWVEWYFTDPRYLCIDNKPVLHIYRRDLLETTFGSVEACEELMTFMREDIKNYGFDGIIILCQTGNYNAESIKKFTDMGADGIMTYAYGSESAVPQWLFDKYDAAYNEVQKQNSHLYIVPTVAQGRNIMGWRNERTPVATPEEHKQVLDYYLGYVEKQNIPGNMVYLATWNEYGEGHWLAPSGLNGFGYADEWRKAYTDAPAVHDDVVPTINQQNRISKLYNDNRTPIRSMLLEKNEIPTRVLQTWDFSQPGTFDGWTKDRYASIGVENGMLVGTAAARDAIVRTPATLTLNASEIKAIRITMRTDVNSSANVFFITDLDKAWHSNKSFPYKVAPTPAGEFTEYLIDVTNNPFWMGTITCLRFDLIEEIGSVEVKKIELLGDVEDDRKVFVDGVNLNTPVYYIEETDNEFYVVGDPDYGIYEANNFYFEWNRFTQKLFIKTGTETEFVFTVGSDKALVNGAEKALAKPFYLYDAMPVLPMKFIYDNAGIEYEINGGLKASVRGIDYGAILDSRVEFEYEFDIANDLEGWSISHGTVSVADGTAIITVGAANSSSTGHDPQFSLKEITLNTLEYGKAVVRLKCNFLPNIVEGSSESKVASMYFATNYAPSLSEKNSIKVDLAALEPDADGYVLAEFDFTTNEAWTGVANLIRFDPTNHNGIFEVDYIRFIKRDGVGTGTTQQEKPATPATPSTPATGAATLESVAGDAEFVFDMDFKGEDDGFIKNFTRSTGTVENGILHVVAEAGQKDVIVGFNLPEELKDSANYDMAIVRIKPSKTDRVQIFFMNEVMTSYAADANASYNYSDSTPKDAEGYYFVKLDLGASKKWAGKINAIRFDPGDIENGEYFIDYIKFYKTGSGAGNEAPTLPLLKKDDVKFPGEIVNGDAEGADISMYSATGGTLDVVTEDNGNKAFHVKPNTMNKTWNYFITPFNFIPGAKYKVSADIKLVADAAGNTNITSKLTCNFRYQDTTNGHQNGYEHNSIVGKDITPADGWVHFEGEYIVETMDANKGGRQDCFTFYCNPAGDLGCEFMIDNIVVTIVE